jgi:hypothetical protein
MNTDQHGSFLSHEPLRPRKPKLIGVLLNNVLLSHNERAGSFGHGSDPCASVFGYPRKRVCCGSAVSVMP